MFYLAVKPLMKIHLCNTETFEHRERSLIYWLDGDIKDNEKIIRIEILITMFNNNGEHVFGSQLKLTMIVVL